MITRVRRSEFVSNPDWEYFPASFNVDGKDHYRQKPSKGNGDAVFEPRAEWGNLHYDEHNALDFPMGTYKHVRKWVSEKTGISEKTVDGLTTAIVVIGIIGYFNRKR
ncbi:MAG: hypothetical protein ACRD3Z_04360 [Nitrososphaerales archaeon]